MEDSVFSISIDKRRLRLTQSAAQLKVFKLKKRRKCKHKNAVCRIPLPLPPKITVWTILNEENAVQIKNCPMTVKIGIISNICEKNYESRKERRIMKDLYYEVLRFCLKRNYPPVKIATLFGMYHATHHFYTSSLWHDYEETYNFFKETVFVHSINDPPESVQIFSIVDVEAILQRFVTLYLPVLPLLREIILPNVRLWMYWHECKQQIAPPKEVDSSEWTVGPEFYTGRSDWDPWDIIPRDEVLNEKLEGDYCYDTSNLELIDKQGLDLFELFGEEENTEVSEEDTEDYESKFLIEKQEESEEEEEIKFDSQISAKDIVY